MLLIVSNILYSWTFAVMIKLIYIKKNVLNDSCLLHVTDWFESTAKHRSATPSSFRRFEPITFRRWYFIMLSQKENLFIVLTNMKKNNFRFSPLTVFRWSSSGVQNQQHLF